MIGKRQKSTSSNKNNKSKPKEITQIRKTGQRTPSVTTRQAQSKSKPKEWQPIGNRICNRSPSLTKSTSKTSLTSNKENMTPNIKSSNQSKPKMRTVKDVRIQNTQERQNRIGKDSKPNGIKAIRENITAKKNLSKGKKQEIKISVHSPLKFQRMKQQSSIIVQQQEDDIMLKYIPPLKDDPKQISISDFFILKTIQKHSYFIDTLAVHKKTRTFYTLRIMNKQQIRRQQKEAQLIQALKIHAFISDLHLPHIQILFAYFQDSDSIYLLLQPILEEPEKQNDNLYEKTMNYSGLQEQEISAIAQELLQTLSQLHQRRLMLREIDLSFVRWNFGLMKITLIQTAASLTQRRRRQSFMGRLQDVSHQLVQSTSYSENADLWHLGSLLYFLITSSKPFALPDSLDRIKSLSYDMPMDISKQLSGLISCLLVQENKRITIEQALNHSFIKERESVMVNQQVLSLWKNI